ncbi:hypothetical protein [Leisingera sp. S232]|uniref:hypothetical protein n=1 Tax=Leisingera sp. S232 TaxID=3415132 RepID=UPI000869F5AB|nr:hypothetical protein AB838_05910 [Rhodobacteraceae bacterium (ex Bugula neritina AB1)]
MTHSSSKTGTTRRKFLAAGSGITLTSLTPVVAAAQEPAMEDLNTRILSLLADLEDSHGSGLAAVNWSRRHIANKLRAALELPVTDPSFDDDYAVYYQKHLRSGPADSRKA